MGAPGLGKTRVHGMGEKSYEGRPEGTLETHPPRPAPSLQKAGEQEEEEEEVEEKKPDPLHQLVLHFSRTALTEKRLDSLPSFRHAPPTPFLGNRPKQLTDLFLFWGSSGT